MANGNIKTTITMRVEKIRLKPGDKLLFTVPTKVDNQTREKFLELLDNHFGKGNCLILSDVVKVTKVEKRK